MDVITYSLRDGQARSDQYYCGCRYHWHKQGLPTDINTGQLLRVLGISRITPTEGPDEERGQAAL